MFDRFGVVVNVKNGRDTAKEEELAKIRANKGGLLEPIIEILSAIKDMPKVMWQLALVYLFQWYALFCYWQNASKSIALSVWKTTPKENPDLYQEAVGWTGLVNGWYNVAYVYVSFWLSLVSQKE
jgi:maltose/moltooligosaccharide transporter